MSFNSIVFDFNGTLFWDTHLHNRAWDIFLENHQVKITDEEKDRTLHGKHNQEILRSLLGDNITAAQIRSFIIEKEKIYQEMVISGQLQLAPGAEDFLNFLTGAGVDFTIATASGIENVDFYFTYLGLSRWFRYEKVVYNNGIIKSKPDPEIFLTAMRAINADPETTIIFEDSDTGIDAAIAAGPGKVIRVNSNNSDRVYPLVDSITHFDQVPKDLF